MPQVDAVHREDEPAMDASTVTPFPELPPRADAARTAVLVYSQDATLIDTVRKAAPRDASVIHAPDLDSASDQLGSQPDVLLLDASSTPDVAGMTAQVARQFPDIVIIVAGRREESAGLMKLTASGLAYRFLLLPLALGQTRLTLEAALRRRVERSMDEPSQPEPASSTLLGRPGTKIIAIGGLALVLAVALVGWFLTRTDGSDEIEAGAANTAGAVVAEAGNPVDASPASTEIALARQAMEREQYIEPAGSSALDHYRAALAIEPTNGDALAGIGAVADRMVERAESALLAERLDQAIASLELARNVQPDHARLPFLDAQVQRERERVQLTQARDVTVRLRNALTAATQRLDAGQLIAPVGQSARDALLEARRIDASDPGVIQGFRDLTTRLLTEAERLASTGPREQSAALLATARELSPSDARVAALERSMTESGPRQAGVASSNASTSPATANSALALARSRIGEGRLIEPAGDSARDHLLAARTVSPNDADVQRLLLDLKDRLIGAGRRALGAQDIDGADAFLKAAADLGVRESEDALTAARRDLDALRAERDFRENVVSAGSLNRTRTITAVYPESARRRGVEGWVDLNFTVTVTGTVTDVTVVGSDPVEVFDSSAIAAVSGWRFEPVIRGSAPVPQRAAARIRFNIAN